MCLGEYNRCLQMARARSLLARGILTQGCTTELNRKPQYLTCCEGLINLSGWAKRPQSTANSRKIVWAYEQRLKVEACNKKSSTKPHSLTASPCLLVRTKPYPRLGSYPISSKLDQKQLASPTPEKISNLSHSLCIKEFPTQLTAEGLLLDLIGKPK